MLCLHLFSVHRGDNRWSGIARAGAGPLKVFPAVFGWLCLKSMDARCFAEIMQMD
jgi:hypothetical protein